MSFTQEITHCRYESSWDPKMLLSRLATGAQYNVLAPQALLTGRAALTTRPYDRKINFIPLTGRSGRRTQHSIRVWAQRRVVAGS